MKIIKIDASNRRNVKLTFDTEIETIKAIKYVANIYREISGDESIKVQRPGDVIRDNDGRYAILDNSLRCALFEMGAIVKRPPKFDHYVFKYQATDEEMELMIKGLEKKINL